MGSGNYDVVIVGAGPAGIFAALTLAEESDLEVAVLERGPDMTKRRCPRREKGVACTQHRPCALVSGWGGAGAYSDGKLNLSVDIGGHLGEYVGRARAEELIEEVDRTYLRFGAPEEVFGEDQGFIEELQSRAVRAELELLTARIRHLGTERCPRLLARMREALPARVHVFTNAAAEELLVQDGTVVGVRGEGRELLAPAVIVAPGRSGAAWLMEQASNLGLGMGHSPVDVGVRVEVPAAVMDSLAEQLYEVKLRYFSKSFDSLVRTFCMCPRGEVVTEHHEGIVTVNGHSYRDRRTDQTNFAVLVSSSFTEPFDQPIAYGQYIARLANLLGEGVLVQRLVDLRAGRRSTHHRLEHSTIRPSLEEATPGDLSFVLPHRHLASILEMLEAMEALAPGVAGRYTLLYGVEAKYYSSRVQVSADLETQVKGLFAIGDGAGITRGLVQASASGIVAARAIIARASE
ncbi:MAG: NAD(P)/FAD-dependent oxidoreductase [Armatimonadota bacterium]